MLLTAAILMAGTLAAPSPDPNAPETAGGVPIRLSKTIHQHTGLERRADAPSGASDLSIHGRSHFSAAMEVGTPPQPIRVGFYAGRTSHLQLFEGGTDAQKLYTTIDGQYYTPGRSSTFKEGHMIGASKEFNATTRADTDRVSIGGYAFDDYGFYGSNTTTEAYVARVAGQAGTLSLGFNPDPQFFKPMWKHIKEAGGSADAGLYLERIVAVDPLADLTGREPHQDNAGELMLGGLNSKYYQGDINYMDVSTDDLGYVSVPLDAIKVNGEKLNHTIQSVNIGTGISTASTGVILNLGVPGPAVINVGSQWFNLGSETFKALIRKIPGSEAVVGDDEITKFLSVPCNTNLEISLSFNGQDYAMRPQDWIAIDSRNTGDKNCMALFTNYPTDPTSLSTAFFQSVYTAWKFDTRQIGFGRLPDGLPTRNTTVNGTVTVDVPMPTHTYANGANGDTPSTTPTPSSPATALQPAFVAAILSALSVCAASFFV